MAGNVRQWFKGRNTALPFVFTINTANTSAGSTTNTQFKLPLVSGGTYAFTVDWGDTSSNYITAWNDTATTHTYSSTGTYTVTITGTCIGWNTLNTGDRLKIINISQWGNLKFINNANINNGYFRGCGNLQITALDIPNFTGLTQIAGMFAECTALTGSPAFNNWNTTGIINLIGVFRNCSNFNVSINNWDVSSVDRFDFMFQSASSFNQNLNSWNTGSAINMASMFVSCTNFNGNISSWNVSGVTDMRSMFAASSAFNQNIGSWDVGNVITFGGSNSGMFFQASSFNQNIGGWNVGNATNMQQMFHLATAFNQNIGSWNVSNVANFTNFMLGKTNLNYSAANLDAIYNGYTDRPLIPGFTTSFGTIKHTSASTPARALLTRTNSTVTVTNAADNGSGLIRITTGSAHGRATGEKIFISGVTGTTEANGGWIITVIDATNFDLQSSTFSNTYVSGGIVRIGYGCTITDGGI
jgi:surface protein